MTIDDDLLFPVRRFLSELQMRTPLESITRNGRARQRRRRFVVTTATATVGATGVLVGVSATGSNTVAPSSHPAPPTVPTRAQLVAYTVTSNGSGSIGLSLRKGANLDPAALRQSLAQHGIPALVTVGEFCKTPSDPVSTNQPFTPQEQADGSVDLTLNPAAIPAGTELSIGYFPHAMRFLLIKDDAQLVCAAESSQPAYHQSAGSGVTRSAGPH